MDMKVDKITWHFLDSTTISASSEVLIYEVFSVFMDKYKKVLLGINFVLNEYDADVVIDWDKKELLIIFEIEPS